MICLSIGKDDINSIVEEVEKYDDLRLVEVRLDFLKQLNVDTVRWISSTLHDMNIEVILTLRGRYPPNKKEELLLSATKQTDYIDIDLNEEGRDRIVRRAKEDGVGVILSHHNNIETPETERIISVLNEESSKGADICKYVSIANKIEDNLMTLEANLLFDKPKIVFCMGEKGRISRVMAPLFGSKWTYSGTDRTAPGQLGFEETKSIISMLRGVND